MRYIAKLSLIFFLALTTQANANTKVICKEKGFTSFGTQ